MKSLYAIAAGAALALLPAKAKAQELEDEVLTATSEANSLTGIPLNMSELQPNGNSVTKYAFVVVGSGRGKGA